MPSPSGLETRHPNSRLENSNIWNANDDLNSLSSNMNEASLIATKTNKTASTKQPKSDLADTTGNLAM